MAKCSSPDLVYVIIVNSILERDLGQFREPCRVPVVVQTLQISIARGPEILLDTSGGTQVWGLSSPGKGQRKRREAAPGISINLPNRAVGVCKLEAPVRISQRGAPSCSSWLKTSVMTAPDQESPRYPPSGFSSCPGGAAAQGWLSLCWKAPGA